MFGLNISELEPKLLVLATMLATLVLVCFFFWIRNMWGRARQRKLNKQDFPPASLLTVEEIKERMIIGRHVAYYSEIRLEVEEIDRLIDAGFKPINLDSGSGEDEDEGEYWFWIPEEPQAKTQSPPELESPYL